MYCPHCGKQSAQGANFCSSCGALAVPAPGPFTQTRIVRPSQPRMIAGVCSGIAIHYGWDIALVRIVFAVFTCLTGGFVGLLLYIAGWVMLPEALYALPPIRPVSPAPPAPSAGQPV